MYFKSGFYIHPEHAVRLLQTCCWMGGAWPAAAACVGRAFERLRPHTARTRPARVARGGPSPGLLAAFRHRSVDGGNIGLPRMSSTPARPRQPGWLVRSAPRVAHSSAAARRVVWRLWLGLCGSARVHVHVHVCDMGDDTAGGAERVGAACVRRRRGGSQRRVTKGAHESQRRRSRRGDGRGGAPARVCHHANATLVLLLTPYACVRRWLSSLRCRRICMASCGARR